MFPLLQIFLLIISTILFHAGITNPNRSSIGDYVADEGFGLTSTVFFGTKIGKALIWISTLYQILYLYLQVYSSAAVSTLFPQISTSVNWLPFTLLSVLGYIFMIVGGLGRIWCYRTLGAFFTFELTIRNSHKLIKTGPYAYVRHPSYTFAVIMTIGMFIIHQRRLGNFFPDSRWIQIQSGPAAFLTCCLIMVLVFKRRVPREEEELKKTFGKEWTEYASKTNRFIPRVI